MLDDGQWAKSADADAKAEAALMMDLVGLRGVADEKTRCCCIQMLVTFTDKVAKGLAGGKTKIRSPMWKDEDAGWRFRVRPSSRCRVGNEEPDADVERRRRRVYVDLGCR